MLMPTTDPIASVKNLQTGAQMPDAADEEPTDAEQYFRLGMMYSTGQSKPLDMVTAHKCFNIAAMHGVKGALRMRNEVAAEMLPSEIAAAQRAARAWLTKH